MKRWDENHTEPMLCTIAREVRHEWKEFKSYLRWIGEQLCVTKSKQK